MRGLLVGPVKLDGPSAPCTHYTSVTGKDQGHRRRDFDAPATRRPNGERRIVEAMLRKAPLDRTARGSRGKAARTVEATTRKSPAGNAGSSCEGLYQSRGGHATPWPPELQEVESGGLMVYRPAPLGDRMRRRWRNGAGLWDGPPGTPPASGWGGARTSSP